MPTRTKANRNRRAQKRTLFCDISCRRHQRCQRDVWRSLVGLTTLAVDYSGVYFLLDGDEVVYIGRAEAVMARINVHRKSDAFVFDTAYFIEVAPSRAAEVEERLIAELLPKYNKQKRYGRDLRYPVSRQQIEDLAHFMSRSAVWSAIQ